jgi:hypothetical protein
VAVVASLIKKINNESLRLPPHFGHRWAQKAYRMLLACAAMRADSSVMAPRL